MQGSIVVRMRFPRVEDFRYRYTRDISRGGVFIQTQKPKPVGSRVVLVLEPWTEPHVALNGEVVTAISPEEAAARGLQAGMGIRFTDLDAEKRRTLEALLAGDARNAMPQAAPGPAPAAAPAPGSDVAQLAGEARRFLATLETRDLYELLGVARDASTADVRRAFLKLTRRFHPDSYFRRVPPEVCQDLEDIYDHLARAYETLRDRDDRMAYDLAIGHLGGNRDGVTGEDMARIAGEEKRRKESPGRVSRGEQLYAEAMRELAAGQKQKAVGNLRLALAFDPENAHIKGKLQELTKKG